jgi:RepB DNA-primase from phage plasmid
MNTSMATEFLTRCFAPGETIALLLRREEPVKIAQRIVRLEQATAPAYMRWLAHENASGMNIYVAANPLRSGSRKRTKESIEKVRHLYLDIDVDGDARLAELGASDAVPKPTLVISTSPGKYQVLWSVQGFDFGRQELALKQLAITFGGDTACTDCNRVIRIPGFQNAKYTPAYPVTVEYMNASVWAPDDFRLADVSPDAGCLSRGISQQSPTRKHTHSEQDWAWVLSELTGGREVAVVSETLAVRRSDKPNPLYYARRTVDMASARLALLAGSSVQDVIKMLEARRIAEIPAALCSARAREIAHTAGQMIPAQRLPESPSKENRNATA